MVLVRHAEDPEPIIADGRWYGEVIDTPRGAVPLAKLATVEEADGPNQIQREDGRRRIVVSGNATARGRERLATLVAGIDFKPWRVFDGTLDVPAFLSVMEGAALHIGPDSGGLHVARVAATPSVSWFRPNHHLKNWFPDDPEQHRAFVAPESRDDGLHGFDLRVFVDAAADLLTRTS